MKITKLVTPALFALLVSASPVFAVGSSGFELATNSARSLGKANAVVADPEEPSTIVFNPAGLTKLEGNQVTVSSSVIVPIAEFEGKNGALSEDASVPASIVPATFVSLSTPIKDLKVGFGVNAPFGLQTQYDSTGNFKYTGYFNEIKTIGYNASGAYQLAPWLSVGGGWTYLESDLKQVAKLNSTFISMGFFGSLPDIPFELDADGHGMGWNAGLLLSPHEQHTLGLFYRSPIQVEYRGTLDIDDIPFPFTPFVFPGTSFNTSVDTDITFPDSLTLGYRFSATKEWDIEVDVAWTNWSVFDRIDVAFGTSNLILDALEPMDEDFNDTISIYVGTSYDFNPTWSIMAGYFYFSMAADEDTYSNVIPDGDRHGATVGFQYNLKHFSIDVSYLAEFISSGEIDNSVGAANGAVVDGDYDSFVQVISIGVTYKF